MPSEDTAIVNQHEFRVVGMSRSGNHAIINWIMEQTRGRSCFLNCAEPKHNPFVSARPTAEGITYVSTFDLDLDAEQQGWHVEKDYLLYNYEDCFLGMITDDDFEEQHDAWVGPSAERRDLLILRDPFNLFASRRKSGIYEDRYRDGQVNLVTRHAAQRIWKQHAREFLRPGRYLPHRSVPISYNAWASDAAYRRRLARDLGLPFTDAGAEAVPSTAGGSSFDGTAYDGAADDMPVLQRWRHYADDPGFWKGFDDEMIAFADEIFSLVPEPVRRHVLA